MNWKNALRDEQPKDDQEVLICAEGVYHLAIFRASKNGFDVQELAEFIPIEDDIYWADLEAPINPFQKEQK